MPETNNKNEDNPPQATFVDAYSNLTISIADINNDEDVVNIENGAAGDQSPISPLDSVRNRNEQQEEDDYFGNVPRIVVYGDYSAKSDLSLDWRYVCIIIMNVLLMCKKEEEIVTEQQIETLLRTIDDKLCSNDFSDVDDRKYCEYMNFVV
jgi:hypothetical protein